MTTKMNAEKFKRFYTGSLSRNEEMEMLKSEEVNQMMEDQWEHPEEMKDKVSEPDFDAVFGRIEQKKNRNKKITFSPLYRLVAGFALLIGIATAIYFSVRQARSLKQIEYATAPGEFKSYNLPDGSLVYLGGNSRIKFAGNFAENRILETEGLVFFKVQKNNSTFKVNAGQLSVIVTGTEFSVDNSSVNPNVEVTLVEGSIQVSNQTLNKQLRPNEKIVFSKVSGEYSIVNTDALEQCLWKESRISFNNSTLADISRQLSSRYGIAIQVEENAAAYQFTFSLTNESLDETIELISNLASIEVRRTEQSVVFSLKK